MLNQTNLFQNNNKFFILQVIKENNADVFYTWVRWGRVGYKGQVNLIPCGGDEAKAIAAFEKKFQEKTKNKWCDRDSFQPVDGKYKLVEMDGGGGDDGDDDSENDTEPANKAVKVSFELLYSNTT